MCHWQKAALLVATETIGWNDIPVMDQLFFFIPMKKKNAKGCNSE